MNQKYKFIKVVKSTRKEKKYMAVFEDRKTNRQKAIHFGSANMSDYTKHKDETRKKLYIMRHIKNEDWSNPLTAGYWAFRYLWSYKTKSEAFKNIKKDLKKKGYL